MHQELEARERGLHREIPIHSQTHHSEGTNSIGKVHSQPHNYHLSQIPSLLAPTASSLMHLIDVRQFQMYKPAEISLRKLDDAMYVSGRIISVEKNYANLM